MKDLNTDAFRLSIAWPRIFPRKFIFFFNSWSIYIC